LPESSIPATAAHPVIWIVDDSPTQADHCRATLCDQAEIVVFSGGAAALERFGTDRRPDLVLLDWNMPDISGLDVCRFIRTVANASEIPILVVTATGEIENLYEAFDAGVNDFVRKPFPPTELKVRARALIRAKQDHDRLAEVERRLRIEAEYREKFIGMLAHDLRQPVSTFTLTNHILRASTTTAEKREKFLDVQQRAGARMTRMISDLLDFALSRPKDGMPIDRRSVDLQDIVERVLDEMRTAHPARVFELTTKGACVGQLDADRVAQIFSNLIGNAVQHGNENSPIRVHLRGSTQGIELEVRNSGPTISAELLPHIFQPFRRGDKRVKRGQNLGLGLYIVEQIAKAHGGAVHVFSDAGETRFEVTLPHS
jgi:signal transduction histidine kinase